MDISYYRQYEPIFGSWYIKNLIGEGSFGKVYEIERTEFGTTYKAALKVITIPQNQSEIKSIMAEGMTEKSITSYYENFVEEIVSEFVLMSKLKGNSHIVSYEDHQVIKHKDKIGWDILIRMELLTPLYDYIKLNTFKKSDVIQLGIDICKALELCQKYRIIHRDIKPENIFVSNNREYKLGDFGIARTLEQTSGMLSKKGTQSYMAPEIYREENYSSNVDIYSLGIVMYRLLNENRTPFLHPYPNPITHIDREKAIKQRISGALIPPPSNADGKLSEIVLKACSYNPNDRYFSPKDMRDDLQAILYNKEEGQIIYQNKDDITIKSIEYVGAETKETIPITDDSEEETEGVYGKKNVDSDKEPTESIFDELEDDSEATESMFVKNNDNSNYEGQETNNIDKNDTPHKNTIKSLIIVAVILVIGGLLVPAVIKLTYNRPVIATNIIMDSWKQTLEPWEKEDDILMKVGDGRSSSAKLEPEGAIGTITYKSDSPLVASVDESGWITALSEGEATITVLYDMNEELNVKIHITVVEIDKDLQMKIIDAQQYLQSVEASNEIDQANVALEVQILRESLANYDFNTTQTLPTWVQYQTNYEKKVAPAVNSLKTAYDKAKEIEAEKKRAAEAAARQNTTSTSNDKPSNINTNAQRKPSTQNTNTTQNKTTTQNNTSTQTESKPETQQVCPVCGSKYHTVHPEGKPEIDDPNF